METNKFLKISKPESPQVIEKYLCAKRALKVPVSPSDGLGCFVLLNKRMHLFVFGPNTWSSQKHPQLRAATGIHPNPLQLLKLCRNYKCVSYFHCTEMTVGVSNQPQIPVIASGYWAANKQVWECWWYTNKGDQVAWISCSPRVNLFLATVWSEEEKEKIIYLQKQLIQISSLIIYFMEWFLIDNHSSEPYFDRFTGCVSLWMVVLASDTPVHAAWQTHFLFSSGKQWQFNKRISVPVFNGVGAALWQRVVSNAGKREQNGKSACTFVVSWTCAAIPLICLITPTFTCKKLSELSPLNGITL